MKRNKEKRDLIINILDAIIILMVFVIIGFGYNLSFYLKAAKTFATFEQDAKELSYQLEKNDYAYLIQGKYINEINGNEKNKSYHELAEYVEAVSKYKVYSAKGYADRADMELAIMDESRKAMGDLTIFADRIDRMFKIKDQ